MIYQIYLVDYGYIYDSSNLGGNILDVSSGNIVGAAYAALDPKLTLEMNGPGSLEFKLAPGHPAYDRIKLFKSTIDVLENDEVIWTGRCISFEMDLNKIKSFKCEGALAFFKDIVLPYQEYDPTTPKQFFDSIITRYNDYADSNRQFIPGGLVDDPDTEDFDPDEKIWRKTDYETTWEILEDMLLDAEGGYLTLWKPDKGNNPITINYVETFTEVCGQPIVFGANLVDINKSATGSGIVTDIVPVCHYRDEVYTLLGFENGDHEENKKYYNARHSGWRVRPNSQGIMVNFNLREHYPRMEKVVEYDMIKELDSVTSLEEKENKGTLTADEKIELATKRASNNDIIRKTKYYMYKNSKKKAKQLERATISFTVNAADLANLRSGYDDETGEAVHLDHVSHLSQGTADTSATMFFVDEGDPEYNFHIGEQVTVDVPSHGINNKLYPITQMTLDLTSGIKDMTIGVAEKRQLTKILKPNSSKSSHKKDSGKHTTKKSKAAKEAETLNSISFTQTHENPISHKDEYHVGDIIALGDYKVGLAKTDGDPLDVTADCTFTIGNGQDAVSANNYEFQDKTDKYLYAHYTRTVPIEVDGESTGQSETVNLECYTKIIVSDSYMTSIKFVGDKPSYKYGDVFNIDEYEIQGRFDDNHTVNIDVHDPWVSFNIANGHIMDKNTPNPLVAYYRGPETGPFGMLTDEYLYSLGNPHDESGSEVLLNPLQENADGFRIRFVRWPTAKKWVRGERFTLYPDGFNVHYELRLEQRKEGETDYTDICEVTDLYKESNPVLLTYTIAPDEYMFMADGNDPTALEARYVTKTGTLRSNTVHLNVDSSHIEDKALDANRYSIEFDLTRCPSVRRYGAGSRMQIQDYAVNLYYTDQNGTKVLDYANLIEDRYYVNYPDRMWFYPANDYIFNGKEGKDPTSLTVYYKSSPDSTPCKDSISLSIDTKSSEESGKLNSGGYSIGFYSYPTNKEWDSKNREEFTLNPPGYTPYKVHLYYTNPTSGAIADRGDITSSCRFSPEIGHAFHGDPIDNPSALYAWYDVPDATDNPRTASCPLRYMTRSYAPGEENTYGWSIEFTQDTTKVWKAGDRFKPIPDGNYLPYKANAYYTDKSTGIKADHGEVIYDLKFYESNPDLCYFVPPIGYRFVGDGRAYENKLWIYYKNSSAGQQVCDDIALNVTRDTASDKDVNDEGWSIEFVQYPQNKQYAPGEELRLKTPSGSPLYRVKLFYTDPQTGVKTDHGEITNRYQSSTGEMWYYPAPGYTFSGKGDPPRLTAYYTGAGALCKDSVPLNVSANTLGAGEADADGWSVEFVSYPSDKKWLPGDTFTLAPQGYTPYKAHLYLTQNGTKSDQGDVTYLYKNSASEYWYNFNEGELFSGESSDPSKLIIYHKTSKGVVWDQVPLTVIGHRAESTFGPGQEDDLGRKLYFAETFSGSWVVGDTFKIPNHYSVAFKDANGNIHDATEQCEYNIGIETTVGGVITERDYSYAGANRHVINGFEPATFKATYVASDGATFWDETPLNLLTGGSKFACHVVITVVTPSWVSSATSYKEFDSTAEIDYTIEFPSSKDVSVEDLSHYSQDQLSYENIYHIGIPGPASHTAIMTEPKAHVEGTVTWDMTCLQYGVRYSSSGTKSFSSPEGFVDYGYSDPTHPHWGVGSEMTTDNDGHTLFPYAMWENFFEWFDGAPIGKPLKISICPLGTFRKWGVYSEYRINLAGSISKIS